MFRASNSTNLRSSSGSSTDGRHKMWGNESSGASYGHFGSIWQRFTEGFIRVENRPKNCHARELFLAALCKSRTLRRSGIIRDRKFWTVGRSLSDWKDEVRLGCRVDFNHRTSESSQLLRQVGLRSSSRFAGLWHHQPRTKTSIPPEAGALGEPLS